MSNKKKNTKKNTSKTNETKKLNEKEIRTENKVAEELTVETTETVEETKKEQKKEKKQKKETKKGNSATETNTNNEMFKLIKIVLIVTGVMLVFYGITLIATNKADEKLDQQNQSEEPAKTEIQYENIMIGSMLSHPGTYYVLIEEEDDNRLPEYESLITTIKASEDAPTIYKANLTDSFNKTYLGKESNYYVEDLADFKVTGTTLVKIKDGKIESVSDSHDAIKNKLNDLA